MKFPVIDYAAHPAFAHLVPEQKFDDGLIADAVRRADDAYAKFATLPSPSKKDSEDALAAISAILGEIKAHLDASHTPMLVYEWVASMMEYCLVQWRFEFLRHVFSARDFAGTQLDDQRGRQLQEMQSRGMYVAGLDESNYEIIREESLKFIPALREQLERQPIGRSVHAIGSRTKLARVIDRALTKAGVLDVLSEFKRCRMKVMGTGLEYSRAGQGWYGGIYSDLGLPDSPMKYLHVDEADHIPKAMIYATPVAEENGPTRIIPESSTWARSELLSMMHKGLDRLTTDRYSRHYSGPGYRLIYREPDLRRVFMSLPKAFQGSSHLGDDILPDSALAQDLAAREIKFLPGNNAQAMIFNGCRILHRGSMVQSGERLALQVIFINANADKIETQILGGAWRGRVRPMLSTLYAMAR